MSDRLPDRASAGALSRCVGVVDEFAEEVWGRRSRVWQRRDADAFGDVFGVAIADRVLATGPRRPAVRLVDGGRNLDPATYTSRLRLGGRWLDDVVDAVKVAERFLDGSTVVFQSLHRTCDEVRRFVGDLGDDISHPVQANAYLTPAGASGLAPHRDQHDVLVVHLAGAKRWHVEDLGEVALHPGDTMYLPAGTEHSASANDAMTLHLTIGIIRTTLRSVVTRILADADELDRPLPLDYRCAPPTQDVERAIAAVTGRLTGVDAVSVAEFERVRRAPPDSRITIASLHAAEKISHDTTVRWLSGGRPLDSDDDHDRRLRLPHDRGTLRLPIETRAALDALTDGRPHRVGSLPGLDPPSRLVLTRRLLEQGIVVVVE